MYIEIVKLSSKKKFLSFTRMNNYKKSLPHTCYSSCKSKSLTKRYIKMVYTIKETYYN